MDRYTETFETWNRVASLYKEKFMHLDIYDDSYDLFCSNIALQNAQILELGCGPGNITQYMLAKRPDFRIHATDVAPNMLDLARQALPTVSFQQLDCRKLNELKDVYAGIMCGFCLPYLSESDVAKLITDCHGLLSFRGMLYLSFVEGDPDQSGYQTGSSGARTYFYYHCLEYIKQLLSRSAFDNIQVLNAHFKRSETNTETHTILLAAKK